MHARRLEGVQRLIAERGLDALLVFSPVNLYYLSGYYPHLPWYPADLYRLSPIIVRAEGEPVHVGVTVNAARLREVSSIRDIRAYDEFTQSGAEFLARVLGDLGLARGRLGFDEENLAVHTLEWLRGALPGARFLYAAEVLKRARAKKDPEEVAAIREAVAVAVKGLRAALAAVRPGRTELEVAAEAEYEMRRRGAERFTEETMVLSGSRALQTRDRARAGKKIEEGDVVILDLGAVCEGDSSDISRTAFAGEPSSAQRRVYERAVEVHRATLAMVRPGLLASEVDAFARRRCAEAGLEGAHLAHVVGHGIGLEFHETPLLKPGEEVAIEPGMVFTVEPSLRVPGVCAVRIEDQLLVTEGGVEVLSKELEVSLI